MKQKSQSTTVDDIPFPNIVFDEQISIFDFCLSDTVEGKFKGNKSKSDKIKEEQNVNKKFNECTQESPKRTTETGDYERS